MTTQQQRPARRLYLAYGSNLNMRQMRHRCPNARRVGKVMFADAKLVFRGVADVVYSPGDQVPCGVWSITPSDERALDAYEGVNSGLYSKETVELNDGRTALIYLMNDDGIMPPSQRYADVIRQGYKDFELKQVYLDKAIRESYQQKAPSRATAYRRSRQRISDADAKLVRMPETLAMKKVADRQAKPEQLNLLDAMAQRTSIDAGEA